MPTLADSQIPPPNSPEEFEAIVCSAAKNRWNNPDFTLHGRKGQSQEGVDVYGTDNNNRQVAIQCKNTTSGLSYNTVVEEVEKAKEFGPYLKKLYVATTAKTDKHLQKQVRLLSAERQKNNLFAVEVLFWSDICSDLTLNVERLYQHYSHLRPTTQPTHDEKLFQDFQATLPYAPAIRLLNEHNFGNAFLFASLDSLYVFVETWNQPEKEFIDSELQNALQKLYESASELSNAIVDKVGSVGNGKHASVFSDFLRERGPRPDFVRKEAAVLNDGAARFVKLYEDFIRLCRSKLVR